MTTMDLTFRQFILYSNHDFVLVPTHNNCMRFLRQPGFQCPHYLFDCHWWYSRSECNDQQFLLQTPEDHSGEVTRQWLLRQLYAPSVSESAVESADSTPIAEPLDVDAKINLLQL